MQITHNHKKVIGWLLRILILLTCGWFIFSQVDERWTMDASLMDGKLGVILLVSLLTFVNWGLEVWRWKLSLDSIGSVTWQLAMQQVFGGLALNWVMSFTSGDLLARLVLNSNREQAGLLIYYNRAIMLVITLLFGAYGVFVFSASLFEDRAWLFALVIGLLSIFGWAFTRFIKRKGRVIESSLLFNLIAISLLRYLVFTLQFYLLISIFNPSLEWNIVLAGIGWIFLFRSVIPSLFGNLGVREAGAMLFFEPHIENMMLVLAPSLLIWLINTVAPSILGLYFLLKFRVKLAA